MLKRFFNSHNLSRSKFHKAALAFTISALLINIGCGKRQPPLPPTERVLQKAEISGFQRGNHVILSWRMPLRNAEETSLLNINRADIYRLVEPLSSNQTLSEEEFASRSNLIATVPISDKDFALQRFSYTDILEFAGQPVRLRYALRFSNASGQKAAFSNFLLLEPIARIAAEPQLLPVKITQEEIQLSWMPPKNNIDGSQPVNILGYNIYRSGSANETAKVLNETPLSETNYSDKFFTFGSEYFYFVRAVSPGNEGLPVESLESNIVSIVPRDIFAPNAPTAITIAAAPNNLSLFFAVNTEKDIRGYRVYRSENRSLPKSQWRLLTPQLLTVNTFKDTIVESGKTYFYFLEAIDNAGNVSIPSEIVSETAP
jgi:hypothetical protein